MIHTLKILLTIFSARVGKDLSNPRNLFFTCLGSVCYFFMHLASFSVVVNNFSFPGWSTFELWTLFYTFEIFTYISFFLLWHGMVHSVRDIGSGKIDLILVKPANSRYLSLFRFGNSHNLVTTSLGVVFLALTIYSSDLTVSAVSVIFYVVSLLLSVWTIHSLAVLFMSLNFIYGPMTGTSGAIYQFQEVEKYPATNFQFQNLLVKLLIFPVALLTSIPASLLISKSLDLTQIITYFITLIGLTIVSEKVWHSAVGRYTRSNW